MLLICQVTGKSKTTEINAKFPQVVFAHVLDEHFVNAVEGGAALNVNVGDTIWMGQLTCRSIGANCRWNEHPETVVFG